MKNGCFAFSASLVSLPPPASAMLPLRSLGASDPLPHATTAAASGLPDSDSPGSCGLDVARADFEIGVDGAAADERQRQERGARAIPPLRLLFRGTLAALQQPHVFYVAVRGCSSAARVAHFNEHACQLPFHRPSVKSLGDFEIFHFAPDARSSSATLAVPPAWLQPFVADVAALVPAVHFNLGCVLHVVVVEAAFGRGRLWRSPLRRRPRALLQLGATIRRGRLCERAPRPSDAGWRDGHLCVWRVLGSALVH